MKIISRKQARERGLERYFTGKPCKNGNIDERNTRKCHCYCSECRAEVAARGKRHYLKDKTKYLERASRYYHSDLERGREGNRRRYQRYRESPEYLAQKREYYIKNRDYLIEQKAIYARENSEALREASRRWRNENRELVRCYQSKRRSAKRNAMPPWYGEIDEFVIQEAYDLARLREEMTGEPWHVDHMIPLQAEEATGFHCAQNIQVIPARLNLKKANKMIYTEPFQWIKDA